MNDALFSFEANQGPTTPGAATEPVRVKDYQLAAIRKAFAEAGIDSQADRQSLVESCAMRPVAALRELTAVEAHRVLLRIQDKGKRRPTTGGSAWDNREEDTWIDKL